MLQRLAAWVLTVLTGCFGSPGAGAQSIEMVYEQAEIGRPLLLRWQVRPFDLDPSRLKDDCLEVHLSTPGEDALALPIDEQELRPLAEQGKALLEVRSHAPVLEPIVKARVALHCGATLSREFSVLVAPGTGGSQAAPSKSPTVTKRSPPRGPGVTEKSTKDTPRRADRLQLDTTARSTAAHALREDQVLAIAQAVASLLLQSPASTTATHPGPSADRSAWDNELRQLRQDQQQARAQMATLQLRLERQQDRLPTQWTSALLGAAGLLAAAALIRLWREQRLPRWNTDAQRPAHPSMARTGPHNPGPPAAPAARTDVRQRRLEPAFHVAGSGGEPTPMPATQAPAAPNRNHPDSGIAPGPIDRPPPPPVDGSSDGAMNFDWPGSVSEGTPPCEQSHRAWATADFGQPDLDAPSHSEAIERLDQMSRDGYHGACIALLEHALQSRPGKNPRLLLRLLELYRQLQQAANHDRVAAQLEALFNLHVPLLSQRGAAPEPSWEESDAPGLAKLSAVWSWPEQAQACLRSWLLSGPHPRLSLSAFEDALCLFDLTQEKLRSPSLDSPNPLAADSAGAGTLSPTPPIEWNPWPGAAAA